MTEYICVNGHDRCDQMAAGANCPYCERKRRHKNTSAIGKREERDLVRSLAKHGYAGRRQPGSGNRGVDMQHDVVWQASPAGRLLIEDKYRDKSQWKTLERWRAGADILTVREARGQRMAYLTWDLLLALTGPADERGAERPELGQVAITPGAAEGRYRRPTIPSRPFPKKQRRLTRKKPEDRP